jgi:hypothetical protein
MTVNLYELSIVYIRKNMRESECSRSVRYRGET